MKVTDIQEYAIKKAEKEISEVNENLSRLNHKIRNAHKDALVEFLERFAKFIKDHDEVDARGVVLFLRQGDAYNPSYCGHQDLKAFEEAVEKFRGTYK